MKTGQSLSGYLTGQLIVAMPAMSDPRFERSVIYMCVHNEDGAMGLVVNRLMDSLTFDDLLQQLGMDNTNHDRDIRVHFGGPVESGRGFVLHSNDYTQEGTVPMENGVSLTATVDILRDIADGHGPRDHLLALGYAWGMVFPINKTLWTSSFVLVTLGYSLILLSIFYYLIDVLGFQHWAKFFAIIGVNSIIAYLATSLVQWKFLTASLFGGVMAAASPAWHSLLQVCLLVLVQWFFLYWLYRRNIFIKV